MSDITTLPASAKPGRPKGSRNLLGGAFLSALVDDFQEHGTAAIRKCREDSPAVYVKVLAGLMPKELELKKADLTDWTEAELDAALNELHARVRDAIAGNAGHSPTSTSQH